MKAMIFAAGLGTRLKPLTNSKPKAMVKLAGKPLLEHVIKKLQKQNINEFVINVHHFADVIINFLEENNNFGAIIHISDERDELLETGGGLKKAQKYFTENEDFIVYNVDIFSDLDISELINFHKKNKSIATLVTQNRKSDRRLVFDEENYLCYWENIKTGEQKPIIKRNPKGKTYSYAFSGIHILNSDIFKLITQKGKFSIVESYLEIAKKNKISAFNFNFKYWYDLGRIENLKEAEIFISNHLK